MKRWDQCRWIHRRISKVVLHLRGRADNDDFVLEECTVGIIGVPKFRIENFVERSRLERFELRETNHMTAKIPRHGIGPPDFGEGACGKGLEDLFAWIRG